MSDLISRQAALDGKISIQRADGVEIYSDEAVPVEYLKNLPSAQQWIPCSERLPKTKSWRTYFIVTTKTGFTTAAEWENTTIRGKEVSRWIWYDKICPFDVIAWMPLPPPMKGEKE